MEYSAPIIHVPSTELSLDQFLSVVRSLDDESRRQVAQTLADTHLDAELAELIADLRSRPPVDISDEEIDAEIHAVRARKRQQSC